MNNGQAHGGNTLLVRGAAVYLLIALALAWCLVGMNFGVEPIKWIFPGKVSRILQAHIDFLLMSALLFGFVAAKVKLPRHVRWAMIIGAFTNPSLFILMAMFPLLDAPPPPPEGMGPAAFHLYLMASILTTTYGFGAGAVTILRSTFKADQGGSSLVR